MTKNVSFRLRNTLSVFCALSVMVTILGALPAMARTAGETSAALRKLSEGVLPQSAAQRVDTRIQLLKEEMAFPSSPAFGIGGGPIDTGYLQRVIMGSVCTAAQRGAEREEIRRLVSARMVSLSVSESALVDRLAIMLGCCGDPAAGPKLVQILEKHPDGYMRFNAAMALGEMPGYVEAIPALRRAMVSDTYARIRLSDSFQHYNSATMVYSPVRAAAAAALKRLGQRVPQGVEVVPAKYGVQAVEPLLYDARSSMCTEVIAILGAIGGAEAKAALQTFIDNKSAIPGAEALVGTVRVRP